MIGFALCHGWSFDAASMETFAAALRVQFPQAAIAAYDLGFTGRSLTPSLTELADPDTRWIAVGHSYGFACLIQQHTPWSAAISLNGFTRFCRRPGKPEGTPVRVLDAMLARLETEPQAVLEDFRRRCGMEQPSSQQLDLALLGTHLQRLRDLDLPLPAYPVLSLSTHGDMIVPSTLTQACFAPQPCTRHEYEGSHLRLLQEPQACMAAIAEFVEQFHG